jgi:hypothetical protein
MPVLHSAGANAMHGLRRTNADKRRTVMLLLQDEEWAAWSDCGSASKHDLEINVAISLFGYQNCDRGGVMIGADSDPTSSSNSSFISMT